MIIKLLREVNQAKFKGEVLQSSTPVIVGFLAYWSKPCQLLEPVLEDVAGICEGMVKVLKVNVDDNPDLGSAYAIQSVPTLIYFMNGTVRLKIVGMTGSKAVISKLLSLTQANISTNEP